MKKVLVPTDFSANSRAGARFAIRWATMEKIELVFIHVHYIMRATHWSDVYFEKFSDIENKKLKAGFKKWISDLYRQMKVRPGKHSHVMVQGIGADISIMDYCRKNPDIEYICISTRGAGRLKKILGTNTGNLITKSDVPVLAIPKNYKSTQITSVLYATDMRNYDAEIQRVIHFSKPLKAKVEVVHLAWPNETLLDKNTMDAALKRKYRYGLNIHIKENDITQSLVENLKKQIRKHKPSVVVMFTNQDRNLFQRIFLSSKSESLSFDTKIPLLVFKK